MTKAPTPLNRAALSLVMFAVLCGLVAPSSALAQAIAAKQDFDVPAGDARPALRQFAMQAKQELVFEVSDVKGIATHAVKGEMTAQEALNAMLSNTGLVVSRDAKSGAFAIRRETEQETKNVSKAIAPNSDRLSKNRETAGNEGSEVVALSPFVVNSVTQQGYTAAEVVSASRFNQKIKDVPQTIVVLTDLFLKEMSVDKLSDAIQMVGGVPVAATRNQDRFSIRGIATAQQYVDGFRDVQEWGGGEFAQVQQLEVIKGPETNLFGNAFALGGIINRITKRPKPVQWTEVDFTGGSYDYYRATLDITGPINESKALLYRVNAAYTSSGSYRDLHDSQRAYASPVFEWKPTKTTDLTVFTEFMYERHQEDNFIPTVTNSAGQQVLTVPISRSIDEPWQRSIIRKQSVRATLDQKFGNHITARLAGFQTYINNPIQQVEYLGIEADQRTIDRRAFWLNRHEHYQYLEADLIGNFQTGPVTHHIALGADWFHTKFRSNVRRAPLASIDLYNPVYGAPLPDFFLGPGAVVSTNTLGTQGDRGYGATYQAGLFNDRLLLIGSSRRDVVTSERELQVTPYQDIHDSPNKKTAPRYGVVVKPFKPVSLYYQYAQAMQANLGAGFRLDGSALDPTTGVSREFGAKTSFLEDHLQISLASFDVRVVDLPVRLDPPNTSFFANSGSNRSTGEEFNITYNDSNLTVMAGWVNQNVRPTTGGVQGPPIPGTPKTQAQLFARYHWGMRNYDGFTLGAGVVYQTNKPLTATAGSQELPGFETYNLNASYSFNRTLKAALSVSNLLDKKFIVASNGTLWRPGDPRTIKLTLIKTW